MKNARCGGRRPLFAGRDIAVAMPTNRYLSVLGEGLCDDALIYRFSIQLSAWLIRAQECTGDRFRKALSQEQIPIGHSLFSP
jgi:hypothetical protein